MNEFELIGRQTVQIENLKRNYAELLGLVGRIKRGEVDPALVLTDEATQTWVIIPGIKAEPAPTATPAAAETVAESQPN